MVLGRPLFSLDGVEEICQLVGGGVVGDAIVAGIRAKLGEHGAVVVSFAAKVQLHGPTQTHVLAGDKLHKGGLVCQDLTLIKGIAGKRLGEDVLNLILRRRHVHHVVQRVVGGAATKLMGDVVAQGDGALEQALPTRR